MAAQDEQGVWRPMVAGLLMASPTPHHHLPGPFIQAVAYASTHAVPEGESVYQRDAQDITGPLDAQIRDACAFVRKNMRVRAIKRAGGGRVDQPEYDMTAVFEAVVNAVAHRDYSMAGAKVRLRLFTDRLELYSPGMLPNTITPESLPFRQAVPARRAPACLRAARWRAMSWRHIDATSWTSAAKACRSSWRTANSSPADVPNTD